MLLASLFRTVIKSGSLTLIDAHGCAHVITADGTPEVTVRLHKTSLHWRMLLQPPLVICEAYVDGELTLERGTLWEFLCLIGSDMYVFEGTRMGRFINRTTSLLHRFSAHNPIQRAQTNVEHHYDLSGELYDLFLDDDKQYSCAYFKTPDDDLELAQLQKKQHIARKLNISPGMRVLDIGSGWGGMALFLAREYDCDVTGVTLSRDQLQTSRTRAVEAGLEDRVHFHLVDYRKLDVKFDRIVSVGMFEHVGLPHYVEFFSKLRSLMHEDAVALIHTIGRMGLPQPVTPWMRKYIFPGGYLPALSQLLSAAEDPQLCLTDLEIWRLHYAYTLHHWNDRFQAKREQVQALYDERFCRMWELYLQGCEMAFRHQDLTVFQLQLTRNNTVLPVTRDYIYSAN